jgi:hypothetical protein
MNFPLLFGVIKKWDGNKKGKIFLDYIITFIKTPLFTKQKNPL